jgi:DNA/RNA-binding protein KIN17
MNSTRWVTLTEFVKHLGRTGKCKVDETPKGWFVTFIDREPETTWENFTKKRPRAVLAKEQHQDKTLTEQIEKATKSARQTDEQRSYEKTELQREDREKVRFVFDATKYKRKGETHRLQKGETVALQLAKTSIFAEGTVTPEHQSIGFSEARR